jgi:DNA polymerase III alpha subunit
VYSISEFSKLGGVSPRAVRLYEEKGLIKPSYRGNNSYRYYGIDLLPQLQKIHQLKTLGFSLLEIKEVIDLDQAQFHQDLKVKLTSVQREVSILKKREDEIQNLLSVTLKIESGDSVNMHERRMFMDGVKEEVIKNLNRSFGKVSENQLAYLDRDKEVYDSDEKREYLEAIKKCVSFAKERNLLMGPGRGASPSSIVLYGLGICKIDPSKYNLIPERFSRISPDVHIDVEFENGQEFVDYCRNISRTLKYGEINAFKMPLLNIIDNVHKRLGAAIDYDSIPDDSVIILDQFRKGDVEKIFSIDYDDKALVMKYENFLPGYSGYKKIEEYLSSQTIYSFADILNITALWRPFSVEMLSRIERYKVAKTKPHTYSFLSPNLKEELKPNFGLVIYQEDIIRILKEYTNWSYDKCNQFRLNLKNKCVDASDLEEFKKSSPTEVFDLILEEIPWAFCKSHTIAFAQFIKQTAVLKSLHKEIYFEEIEKWENLHGFSWSDIGIKLKGVSLLQN